MGFCPPLVGGVSPGAERDGAGNPGSIGTWKISQLS